MTDSHGGGPPSDPDERCPTEKRQFVRIQPSVLIELKDIHDIRGFVRSYVHDISLGGMFVKVPQPKPSGTVVRFRLPYNHGRHFVELEGKVIRAVSAEAVNPDQPNAGMAVEFFPMEITARAILRKIIVEYTEMIGSGESTDAAPPREPPPEA